MGSVSRFPHAAPPAASASGQFAAAFEFSPIGMALLDLDSRGERVNHALCEMFGFREAELIGRSAIEISHPDDVEEDRRLRALMLSGAFPSYERDKRYLHRTGRIVWTHISCSLVHDEVGQPWRFLLQVQDITQRKLAEEAQRESEERYRATFERAALGILHIGLDGRIVRVNETLCRMHGYSREELLAMSADDLLADRGASRVRDVQALLDGRIFSYTARREFMRKGGEVWPARVSVTLVRSELTAPYFVSIVEDLTEHERDQQRIRDQARELARVNEELEARIVRRTAQLEESNAQLRIFAYSLAHDLRGPLASTDGFARQLELLLGDRLDERARHYLNRVRAGVHSMSDLTDALLSLANLSQEPLQQASVDLSALARAWLERIREREPARRVQAAIEDTPRVQGDARLLALLVDNLLDNAWKFTSRRSEARIAFRAEAGEGGPVFVVEDDGAGFDPEYADKLFLPFQRLHGAQEFTGTGMGLAIVHRIAQRHGGRVWASSRPGEGATFRFQVGTAPR
ncbi:sensor histidine kinase [Ramlibacter sp. PS4R-6]|uniref:sensor histidine kinase n=1 Tax=Ramlibacter sp. PS4R-6 TaxID=3133438 RepID=UPI003096D7F4